MNIDSSAFTVDKYVGTMLQYKSLEELVHRGNAMVSEIKSLDSDMQMLVYENYNKFISATETIKRMKANVEAMDGDMNAVKYDACIVHLYHCEGCSHSICCRCSLAQFIVRSTNLNYLPPFMCPINQSINL